MDYEIAYRQEQVHARVLEEENIVLRAQLAQQESARKRTGETGEPLCDTRSNICELILQEAPIGIAILSGPDYHFTFANPGFSPFACSRQEIVGHAFAEIFPEMSGQAFSVFGHVRNTGETYRVVDVPLLVRCDDELQAKYFTAIFSLLPTQRQEVADILMMVQDTTHRVLVEQEKQRLVDEAEAHARNWMPS